MNEQSIRALEFEAIRTLLLGHAGGVAGKDRIQALAPALEPPAVREALARTTEAVILLQRLGRQPYHDLPDLGPILPAARVEGLFLEPRALLDVSSFIEGGGEICRRVAREEAVPRLARLASTWIESADLAAAIRRAILPSAEVADEASPRLAETRRALVRLKSQLTSVMESFLRGKDADRVLQDKIVTTRNDRYVLLLKAEHRGQIPGIIHGGSGSGASLFVEPMPAVELNNDIVALQEDERREVVRILRELTARVGERADAIEAGVSVLGELDALQAMALAARDMDAVEPAVDETGTLELFDARHPLLISRVTDRLGIPPRALGVWGRSPEGAVSPQCGDPGFIPGAHSRRLWGRSPEGAASPQCGGPGFTSGPHSTKRDPVPVTVRVGGGESVLVISGPNTGGKTVTLKTVGLFALMAQCGLHVPAAPGSRLPVFRRVFADIGDDQSIAANLSTFSAHLAAIVAMTAGLELPALVLLDEVGAGTDPGEGGALGVAIVDYFRQMGATVVATTHIGLMKAYAQSTTGVGCASFGYDPRTYEPTYRLELGTAGRSLALEMAERLGLPGPVVRDARARLSAKEAQAEALLKTLEQEKAELEDERQRLTGEQQALREREREQEERAREAETRRRREVEAFRAELRRRTEQMAREATGAIHRAVQRVEQSRAWGSGGEAAKRREAPSAAGRALPGPHSKLTPAVDKARQVAMAGIREAEAAATSGPELALPEPEAAPAAPLQVGSRVKVQALGVVGEVMALAEGQAEVAVSGKRLRVPVAELAVLSSPAERATGRAAVHVNVLRSESSVHVARRDSGAPAAEINIVGLHIDEALPKVDKLLDEAALSDRRELRVVHGFGTGRLRKAVQGLLQGHPHVATFHPADPSHGGGGVTVVELKD